MLPPLIFSLSSADATFVTDPNLVITLPADALAPNGARPSADTMLTEKLGMFSFDECVMIGDIS